MGAMYKFDLTIFKDDDNNNNNNSANVQCSSQRGNKQTIERVRIKKVNTQTHEMEMERNENGNETIKMRGTNNKIAW